MSRRLVLVVAGAGSGKTTLLADFSAQTRMRTLWYRIDGTDRSLLAFATHLVLAIRQVIPDFGRSISDLLISDDNDHLTGEGVASALLPSIAAACKSGGLALILDDYQEVSDVPEIDQLVRRLVSQGPDRLCVVIASRTTPPLPVSRLRLSGEVGELSGEDLRFDEAETDRLFRDVYCRPLEPRSIKTLTHRTEGWAASLQMVEAALRGKTSQAAKVFIDRLSGADGQLYDYLADEVFGHLSSQLQAFLIRVSILPTFDQSVAAVAAQTTKAEAGRLLRASERSGLLQRGPSGRGQFRFHPLMRDFLVNRLTQEVSESEIGRTHLLVADATRTTSWRQSVYHLVEGGQPDAAATLLNDELATILARGDFEDPSHIGVHSGPVREAPSPLVLASRVAFRSGRPADALALARAAAGTPDATDAVRLNLMSIAFSTGDFDTAASVAMELAETATDPAIREIAQLQQLLLSSSLDGPLEPAAQTFLAVAASRRKEGHRHYEGIALVNAAVIFRAIGSTSQARTAAEGALDALEASSAGPERASARLVLAWALAHDGDVIDARLEVEQARIEGGTAAGIEISLELADLETWYGDSTRAQVVLDSLPSPEFMHPDQAEQRQLAEDALALRKGRGVSHFHLYRFGHSSTAAAMEARRMSQRAHSAVIRNDAAAEEYLRQARAHAESQGAGFWVNYISVLETLTLDGDAVDVALSSSLDRAPAYVGIHAEATLSRFPLLSTDTLVGLERTVRRSPCRWRETLRAEVRRPGPAKGSRLWAGRRLDVIGERQDILPLRKLAKAIQTSASDANLGRELARRLADPVVVHDLNRVSLDVGEKEIPGTQVRKKALSLLCFLLTRTGFSATKDEVIDALWPDTDPGYALNSLNQTAYFLRRVLEPDFVEDQSPGYLRYQSDVVWLDQTLVSSDSSAARHLIAKAVIDPRPDLVDQVSLIYTGRFALDFAYEDWAADFRDSLHASYLSVIEDAVSRDLESGHTPRGVLLAQRALAVDPQATEIEEVLVKLYSIAGAHSAAAEQYEHYAASLRDNLGIDPPPLVEITG